MELENVKEEKKLEKDERCREFIQATLAKAQLEDNAVPSRDIIDDDSEVSQQSPDEEFLCENSDEVNDQTKNVFPQIPFKNGHRTISKDIISCHGE